MIKNLVLFLAVFAAFQLDAQVVVEQSNDIPVLFEDGTAMDNPWTGGINAAQFSTLDIDQDGEQDDLFIFDKAGNKVLVFEGVFVDGQKEYIFSPEYSNQFPELLNFALLRDYDCDGKKDIFTYSNLGGGMAVYRNTSNPNSLSFELVIPLLNSWYPFSGGFSTNIFVSSQDVPAIFDFEGDGDIDFLTFGVSGSTVELHFNQSVESTGTCGLDTIELANRCYGKFIEASEDNGIIQDEELFETICGFNVPNPKSNRRNGSQGGARHIGSTILAFDATQDGLADMVIGDVSFNNLTYLENSEGTGVDSVVYVADDFPVDFGAPATDIDNFPAAFYEDVSGDGVKDLLVGVNNADVASNRNSSYYYENIGENDAPIFTFVEDNFIQGQTVDFGETSAPAVTDINGDGLIDIVLGSRGEFLGLTEFKPRISLYINNGTQENPAFILQDEEWIDLDQFDIQQFPDPTFGDIDTDGDLDLLIGDNTGLIYYFENTAGPGNEIALSFNGVLTAGGEDLDVGQKSSPQLYDLNNDGLLDLVVGERNGNINYYQNTGSPNAPVFEFVTDTLGGLTTLEEGIFVGSSCPHFFVTNGTLYLAAGSESGRVHLYDQIENNLDGDFNLLTLDGFDIYTGGMNNTILLNINNDIYPDILAGGIGGGLQLYMGQGFLSTINQVEIANQFQLYPNPAQQSIRISGLEALSTVVDVFAVDGKLLERYIIGKSDQLDISSLDQGVYLLKILSGDRTETLKLIKK